MTSRLPQLLLALLLTNGMLVGPDWLATRSFGSPWIALEALAVVGTAALLPRRRWSRYLVVATSVVFGSLAILVFWDAVVRTSLARPLSIYLDVRLLGSVHHLLSGVVGPVGAWLFLGAAAGGAGACVWGLVRLLLQVRLPGETVSEARTSSGGRTGARAAVPGAVLLLACGSGLWVVLLGGSDGSRLAGRVVSPAVRVADQQLRHLGRMLSERERFAADLVESPASYATGSGLLGRLDGRAVLLGFVESYGVSAIRDERYAPVVRPALTELERRVASAGLHMATGTLVAPTQGGQSWFSHGTLLSGLWLDNQLRYDLLLASGRETLVDDFRSAGYRTVALVPAITLAWPEGERLGYDEIFARKNIDYRGPALNWVTMPDQFTWSFLERVIRGADDSRPLFAEVSLISSHAPWTPILPVLDDWEEIGDGSVFGPWENAGERPEDLWRDLERVREHFALAVAYAIRAVTGYAERYVDHRTLLIALGDHQPAPLITGEGASRSVPVHVISGDPEVVRPFLEWGFQEGAFPPRQDSDRRMDAFRAWFVEAFRGAQAAPTSVRAEGGGP